MDLLKIGLSNQEKELIDCGDCEKKSVNKILL